MDRKSYSNFECEPRSLGIEMAWRKGTFSRTSFPGSNSTCKERAKCPKFSDFEPTNFLKGSTWGFPQGKKWRRGCFLHASAVTKIWGCTRMNILLLHFRNFPSWTHQKFSSLRAIPKTLAYLYKEWPLIKKSAVFVFRCFPVCWNECHMCSPIYRIRLWNSEFNNFFHFSVQICLTVGSITSNQRNLSGNASVERPEWYPYLSIQASF